LARKAVSYSASGCCAAALFVSSSTGGLRDR
jgi:hypothetical protein